MPSFIRMFWLVWAKLCRFSLRALFFAVTGCAVALAIWRTPFEADVKNPDEFMLMCASGMTSEQIQQYHQEREALRETGFVYRDFHGNRIKHGVAVLYDGNGVKLRERHWSHGKLEGLETSWNDKGEIEWQTRYRDGKRHGWKRQGDNLSYYEDDVLIRAEMSTPFGKLVQEYHPDGSCTWTEWSQNAEKLNEVTYDKEFLRQGATAIYHANGLFSCRGTWRNNREHRTWSWWDERGTLVRTIEFADGEAQSHKEIPHRRKFILEDEFPARVDEKLSGWLFGHSYLGTYHKSLSEAFAWLEGLHNNHQTPPPNPPFRIQVRGDEARALLDNAKVSKEADHATLREALPLLLTPLHLEAVVHDNSIWIVDADEARDWIEAIPVSRFVSRHPGYTLGDDKGLKLGHTNLQGLLEAMKAREFVLRVDDSLEFESAALLAREIDADVPGCTVAAALDIALNQVGLTYYAENDQFVIVRLESP